MDDLLAREYRTTQRHLSLKANVSAKEIDIKKIREINISTLIL